MVRTETHKYLEYGNGETELYCLWADPRELESLYEGVDPFLRAAFKAKLNALKGCSRERCWETEDTS